VQSTKKVGRPRAKHSSPDYAQVSVYVHKDIRNRVKARLFKRGEEFSGLVESLLRDWLMLRNQRKLPLTDALKNKLGVKL